MKYFTEDWHTGKLTDSQTNKSLKEYSQHLDTIYNDLPFVLKALSRNLPLHDGRILSVCYHSSNRKLVLNGIFGDLEIGYFSLRISYLELFSFESNYLEAIKEKPFLEILSDEIDITVDSQYLHRILFSSYDEIEIQFSSLSIELSEADSKDYKKQKPKIDIIRT
ncbi:hypothetical protein COB11_08285 [Candidatus Aerophobetes bacterium]|uniref:Uncharacterized protein n=1 Tax=Aerophobetes bacterium TaxID=2030807 RepID=A0A2A4YAC1_UNCAE|nr:MAG: hypothetical protein COB11_08285 [Candidatus Aerophobetes bacterium]